MKQIKKRLLALLLAALLLLGLLPTGFAADARASDDIWTQITAYEDAHIPAVRGRRTSVSAYAALAGEIAELVKNSEDYAEGTCTYHGENAMFFWETDDGEVYGYSPRLRAQLRATVPAQDEEADSGVTDTLEVRGGTPNSKNVAVFQPYYGIDDSFTTQYQSEGKSVASALGGTCTTYTKNNATIDAIADAMETCAVVFFDSHGDTDYVNPYDDEDFTSRANTSYICLQSGTGLTAADRQKVTGPYGTYYHAYNAGSYINMKYYCVDGTAIANHMEGSAPNSMLWMAICLGMANDGLFAPLRAKGVETVYGYSQSVTFYGDYIYEGNFWNKMKQNATVAEAIKYMKTAAGCNWDPAYSSLPLHQAVQSRCAFPIVVSSEDVYPGHGNVDAIQQVNSTWRLRKTVEYTLTANVNDAALGTVAVSGHTVVATPVAGAKVAGYTLTPSNGATVTRSGNTFTVTDMRDNCNLTVLFQRKTTAVVHFCVPDGCSAADKTGYIGEAIPLDAPVGTPLADARSYTFSGWSEAPFGDTTVKPTLYTDTFTPKSGETTLYAAYRYTMSDGVHYTTELKMADEFVLTAKTNNESLGTVSVSGNTVTAHPLCASPIIGWSLSPEGAAEVKREGNVFTVVGMTQDCTLTVIFGQHTCYAEQYTDVDLGAWYHEPIDFVIGHAYMTGVSPTRFAPNGTLTRAMLVTILYRIAGAPECHDCNFVDVPAGIWYADAVAWAQQNGIVNGVSLDRFAPENPVTREQLALILYRWVGLPPAEGSKMESYDDNLSVSSWAYTAMCWANDCGIINGTNGNRLNPQGSATRAQSAAMLYRLPELTK